MVKVEVPEAPLITAGKKNALVLVGMPLTLNVTSPENPFVGVTITEKSA